MNLPIWAIALVLAAAAPMIVRVLADGLEAKVKRQTEATLASARRGRASRTD